MWSSRGLQAPSREWYTVSRSHRANIVSTRRPCSLTCGLPDHTDASPLMLNMQNLSPISYLTRYVPPSDRQALYLEVFMLMARKGRNNFLTYALVRSFVRLHILRCLSFRYVSFRSLHIPFIKCQCHCRGVSAQRSMWFLVEGGWWMVDDETINPAR